MPHMVNGGFKELGAYALIITHYEICLVCLCRREIVSKVRRLSILTIPTGLLLPIVCLGTAGVLFEWKPKSLGHE